MALKLGAGTPNGLGKLIWPLIGLVLVARLGSSQYAHGPDGVLEVEAYYLSMPKSEQSVLGLHMMTGVLLMGFGVFQFWPAFRKRFRKLHRLGGAIYLLAATVSLSMSSYYLYVTDVKDIFNEWIFATGLWMMVVIATSSLLAAGVAILKKHVGLHLGWQAVAFGTFLTAPIQRIYWIGMAPFSGEATFNEMNILVNVSLFAHAFLGSYLIFLMNRSASMVRVSSKPAHFSEAFESLLDKIWGGTLILLMAVTVAFFMGGVGVEQVATNWSLMKPEIGAWHDQVFAGWAAWLWVFSTLIFVVCGVIFTRDVDRSNDKSLWLLFLIAGASICLLAANWAVDLGKPSHEVSVAGVMYGYQAFFLLGFLLAIFWMKAQGNLEMVKELLYFALLLALAPAMMWLSLLVIGAVGLAPSEYDVAGHGYQAASATALMAPMLVGMVRAMYSAYSRQFAIN